MSLNLILLIILAVLVLGVVGIICFLVLRNRYLKAERKKLRQAVENQKAQETILKTRINHEKTTVNQPASSVDDELREHGWIREDD
ncbi:MAG: DUF2681 domain-containing protein [Gammaproteobacteria bacterium]|nr:DUF2681 domain-containing protein [Gammaproteobacteria bacterium]